MKKTIPIEDIGYVVLEHQQTSITLPLLNALSDNNVAVIFCDENRMPNAMLMNLDSNKTQGADLFHLQHFVHLIITIFIHLALRDQIT